MGFEGQDSTVRPKLKTWHFDQGRRYLDEWAAEGKPYLSGTIQRRIRVLKAVVPMVLLPVSLALNDFGEEENVLSGLQRELGQWWRGFVALDVADVAKARYLDRLRWTAPAKAKPRDAVE